ncbi:MAG TPA: hypothetical protein VIZ61_12905 [Solirubrobacterales bacterium]
MARGWALTFPVAAIAALACVCLLAASQPALGAGDSAHAASSKAKRSKACKKKNKKARKAGACKKRGRDASFPPVPRTVTLTWDSAADIDLEVYDINGHHSGLLGGSIVNGIPGATHSANDTDGFGPETFNDPSGRRVGYLVCYRSGPHANVTLTDSGKGGGHYTAGLGPTESPPTEAYSTSMGWGYLPVGAHC